LIRVYSPPEPGKVLINKINNWIEYENSNSIDPLIKMALLHYQFESIHPFSDGNGRTGRIAIPTTIL
jgi:Fic family protein